MKQIIKPSLLLVVFPLLLLTACQESLKSSDYYREHLDEAQQTERKESVKRCDKQAKNHLVISVKTVISPMMCYFIVPIQAWQRG